jgi:aryl-alcohol dehydrogenase-like predicted oxidoreductase
VRYKLLGKSGLRVSELCLGTMTFGEEWELGISRDESRKVFDAYVEAGGNFLDTANRYTNGTSEKTVGEFVGSERDSFVIATKYTLSMRHDDPNASGNQRKNMVQAAEASLKRLGTDYIDLYWLHAWDFTTPVEEVMRAFDDLVRAGKVLYIGISNAPAWIVSQANTLSELRGWTQFVGLQIEYSLIQRTAERDLLPMARAFDIAVTPWAVLGAGVLTGKYKRGDTELLKSKDHRLSEKSVKINDRNFDIVEEVARVADDAGRTPSQVALRWAMQKPGLIIPIVGARRDHQIKENLGCLEFELSEEQMQRLDEVTAIDLGYPHEFLRQSHIMDMRSGGTHSKTDNHRSIDESGTSLLRR